MFNVAPWIAAQNETNALNHNEKLAVCLSSYIMEMWICALSYAHTTSRILCVKNVWYHVNVHWTPWGKKKNVRNMNEFQNIIFSFWHWESVNILLQLAIVSWNYRCSLPAFWHGANNLWAHLPFTSANEKKKREQISSSNFLFL